MVHVPSDTFPSGRYFFANYTANTSYIVKFFITSDWIYIMASPLQKRVSCGHVMAAFVLHSKCEVLCEVLKWLVMILLLRRKTVISVTL